MSILHGVRSIYNKMPRNRTDLFVLSRTSEVSEILDVSVFSKCQPNQVQCEMSDNRSNRFMSVDPDVVKYFSEKHNFSD